MDTGDIAQLPRIVILGAGFGGLQAARGLARAPVRITLIDRNNYHLFQPLLYQVATAALSPADVAVPIRSVLRRQRNAEVLLGEVTGVDTRGREVSVRDCAGAHDVTVPYDYLVVATGAMGSYFGHGTWASFAPGLKSLEDAMAIRSRILLAFEAAEQEMVENPQKAYALLCFVIVGGGPTGVELAGAIAETVRKALAHDFRHIDPTMARVLLVEGQPRLLAAFPADLSAHAEQKLRALGVEVRTGTHVEEVTADGVVVAGARIPARTVIWAAGVEASPAGQWLGAAVDRAGRVRVCADLSVPGHLEIFVLGDAASLSDVGAPLPGVASVALQQGRYVAQVIRARLAGGAQKGPFAYVDKGMLATVGRAYALADVRGVKLHGYVGWITWLAVHILYLTGLQNRTLVLLQWAWAYLTYRLGARLILSAAEAAATTETASGAAPAHPRARPAGAYQPDRERTRHAQQGVDERPAQCTAVPHESRPMLQ
jgi:NADH:ubiquinone reductase (H+-translocating)